MIVKKTHKASGGECKVIEKFFLGCDSSAKKAREPFLQVLRTVPGLSADDQNRYARIFVNEKIRGVSQLSQMDAAALKAIDIPMGDAVEIVSALMRLSNQKLISENSSSSLSISTSDLAEIELPELPEETKYYGFVSHNWGTGASGFANHARTNMIVEKLREAGVPLWFDHDRLTGDIESQITSGVDASHTFISFVTRDYVDKVIAGSSSDRTDWCHYEFTYAGLQKPNKMIAVVMEPDMLTPSKWKGAVGARLGGKIFVDFSSDDKIDTACADLVRTIVSMMGPPSTPSSSMSVQ